MSNLVKTDGCCFATGTLVHTEDGLRPIESIKVGDLVLSQADDGGEQAYKRVAKTTRSEKKAVSRVYCYLLKSEGGQSQSFIVTGAHPFFVSGHDTEDVGGTFEEDLKKSTGWRRADSLGYGALLKLASGKSIRVGSADPIWRTRTEGVGWIDSSRWSETGSHIDLRDGQIIETLAGISVVADFLLVGGFCDRYDDDEIADEWAYKCTVYNLEVEDFHTYYVGELGVLVHNADCLNLAPASNSSFNADAPRRST